MIEGRHKDNSGIKPALPNHFNEVKAILSRHLDIK